MILTPLMHVGLLFLLLVNALPVIEAEQSWLILSITIIAALMSFACRRILSRKKVPRWVIYFAVAASMVYLVYEMYWPKDETTVQIIDLAHFLIFLACCKLFELQLHRDVGVVALIIFLLLAIGAFASASSLFALALVVDGSLGIAWMISFQTAREAHRIATRRKAVLAHHEEVLLRLHDEQRESLAGGWKASLTCSALLIVIATIVFVSVPRAWGRGLFGRMQGLVPAITGFSEQVKLTEEDVYEDETPVMRVRFERDGKLLTDENFVPYLRGLTYDRYNEGQWRRPPLLMQREVLLAGLSRPAYVLESEHELDAPGSITQETWLEPSPGGIIFALFPTFALTSNERIEVNLDPRDLIMRCSRGTVRKLHYTAYSVEEPSDAMLREIGQARYGPRIIYSTISTRVSELAKSLTSQFGDSSDPGQHEHIATALCDYLQSNVFQYTLHRGPLEGKGDLIEDFLFKNRKGHCEYFASAMTLLCQA